MPAKKIKTTNKTISKKQKKYPAYILGIILSVMLLAEGILITNTTPMDWKQGLAILDVSDGVTSMVVDVQFALEPFIETFNSVTEFYNQAAIASAPLFDVTNPENMSFVYGVNNFYQEATTQMAQVLDLSNYLTNYMPQVAGATTFSY